MSKNADLTKLADIYTLATTPTVLNGVFLSMAQRASLAAIIRRAYVVGFEHGSNSGDSDE